MNRVLLFLLLLAAAATEVSAQAYVQISAIRARPETLNCVGPGATTLVRLQVYLAGLPPTAKTMAGTVQLALYSAHPSINKLEVTEPSKDFALSESPALVDFEVHCTGDTVPGEVTLAAVISSVPEGIQIKEPTMEPAVHIKMVPSR